MLRTSQQTRYLKHVASYRVYAGHCQQKEYLTYAMPMALASCYTMWKIYGTASSHTTFRDSTIPHDSKFFGKHYLEYYCPTQIRSAQELLSLCLCLHQII